jgi:hypothetical protein
MVRQQSIACFDAWIMKVRLNSIVQQVLRGNFAKAVDTIDDTIFQLDNCSSTDIAAPWRDEIWNLLSTAECLIMCDVVDEALSKVLQDIDAALKKNDANLWAKAITARLRMRLQNLRNDSVQWASVRGMQPA